MRWRSEPQIAQLVTLDDDVAAIFDCGVRDGVAADVVLARANKGRAWDLPSLSFGASLPRRVEVFLS